MDAGFNRSNLFFYYSSFLPLILELENLETKIFNLEEDMDWLGNNVKTFKVKGITIIANRNNGMVIGLDREGEEVVDLLKSNLIEISSLSDNQKELYKVLEENDFLKSCYKEIKRY